VCGVEAGQGEEVSIKGGKRNCGGAPELQGRRRAPSVKIRPLTRYLNYSDFENCEEKKGARGLLNRLGAHRGERLNKLLLLYEELFSKGTGGEVYKSNRAGAPYQEKSERGRIKA